MTKEQIAQMFKEMPRLPLKFWDRNPQTNEPIEVTPDIIRQMNDALMNGVDHWKEASSYLSQFGIGVNQLGNAADTATGAVMTWSQVMEKTKGANTAELYEHLSYLNFNGLRNSVNEATGVLNDNSDAINRNTGTVTDGSDATVKNTGAVESNTQTTADLVDALIRGSNSADEFMRKFEDMGGVLSDVGSNVSSAVSAVSGAIAGVDRYFNYVTGEGVLYGGMTEADYRAIPPGAISGASRDFDVTLAGEGAYRGMSAEDYRAIPPGGMALIENLDPLAPRYYDQFGNRMPPDYVPQERREDPNLKDGPIQWNEVTPHRWPGYPTEPVQRPIGDGTINLNVNVNNADARKVAQQIHEELTRLGYRFR
jgi:hypothetical protein